MWLLKQGLISSFANHASNLLCNANGFDVIMIITPTITAMNWWSLDSETEWKVGSRYFYIQNKTGFLYLSDQGSVLTVLWGYNHATQMREQLVVETTCGQALEPHRPPLRHITALPKQTCQLSMYPSCRCPYDVHANFFSMLKTRINLQANPTSSIWNQRTWMNIFIYTAMSDKTRRDKQ